MNGTTTLWKIILVTAGICGTFIVVFVIETLAGKKIVAILDVDPWGSITDSIVDKIEDLSCKYLSGGGEERKGLRNKSNTTVRSSSDTDNSSTTDNSDQIFSKEEAEENNDSTFSSDTNSDEISKSSLNESTSLSEFLQFTNPYLD